MSGRKKEGVGIARLLGSGFAIALWCNKAWSLVATLKPTHLCVFSGSSALPWVYFAFSSGAARLFYARLPFSPTNSALPFSSFPLSCTTIRETDARPNVSWIHGTRAPLFLFGFLFLLSPLLYLLTRTSFLRVDVQHWCVFAAFSVVTLEVPL